MDERKGTGNGGGQEMQIRTFVTDKLPNVQFVRSSSLEPVIMSADAQHVQYILLAEFDIDKGASLNHQYPSETGTNEQ